MKALIVSGGSFPSKEIFEKELDNCQFKIAVDKGMELYYENNIIPDLIVGDFDSVNCKILDYYIDKNIEIVRFPAEKDYTDTHLAILKCLERDIDEIVLLGCTGTRLDHTLGNIGLLFYCMEKNLKAYIKDDHNTIFMTDKNIVLPGKKSGFFSLSAFGGIVEGLRIGNAKYELNDYSLKPWESVSISNEFIGKDVHISLDKGIILVIYGED